MMDVINIAYRAVDLHLEVTRPEKVGINSFFPANTYYAIFNGNYILAVTKSKTYLASF
jgi:hypothetical protein